MSAETTDLSEFVVPLHGAGKVVRKIEKGRCLHDGYRRALSLQYGNFSEKLPANRLFARAVQNIGRTTQGPRSIISAHKREIYSF